MCYTLAGPEVSEATTKAYSTQLVVAYLLAIKFALVRGTIDEKTGEKYLSEIAGIPEKMETILSNKERLQWFAAKYASANDVFFEPLGTGKSGFLCVTCGWGLTPSLAPIAHLSLANPRPIHYNKSVHTWDGKETLCHLFHPTNHSVFCRVYSKGLI